MVGERSLAHQAQRKEDQIIAFNSTIELILVLREIHWISIAMKLFRIIELMFLQNKMKRNKKKQRMKKK